MIWSAKQRTENIEKAVSKEFDILIIGGGITAAGVAREAALRNYSFCIIEKNDFAFGTSSRSSKLIHGGIRYLANGEFSLVRESTTERNWLRAHFPNLVRPLGFLFCSYENGKDKTFSVKVAVKLYNVFSDCFSTFKNYRKGKFFSAKFIQEIEPEVAQYETKLGKLKMAGYYYDNNVDDARLTIETIKEALEYSKNESIALNYIKVESFQVDNSNIKTVKVHDQYSDKTFTIKGKTIVNCTGIWTDDALKMSGLPSDKIYPTKGVHVVVPNERIGNRNAFGIRSFDDGRFFFILRRGKVSVIGTTDTDYYKESSNLDEPWCTKEDCDYLFNSVNRMFPHAHLNYNDIIGTYAGIRPLIKQNNAKNESAVSREHEIFDAGNGVLAIAGGKLTTYRKMAEEILYLIIEKNYLSKPENKKLLQKGYSKIPFLQGITRDEFDKVVDEKEYYKFSTSEQLEQFYTQYGKQAFVILDNIIKTPAKAESLIEGYTYCAAEIEFIIENENVLHLIDILCRRTEAQWMVWHYKQKELAEKIAEIMAVYFSWDNTIKNTEIDIYLTYTRKTIWFNN